MNGWDGMTAGVNDGAVDISIRLSGGVNGESIIVYRREDETFTFGKDYEAYFSGLSFLNEDRYDGGEFHGRDDDLVIYRDDSVSVGSTYVYWMTDENRTEQGMAAVTIRDPEIWWPATSVRQSLKRLANRFPDIVEYRVFGTSAQSRDISGLIAGNRNKLIALTGLIHAGESGPELMIPAIERLLNNDAELLAKVGIAILPGVNVDERERLVNGCPWYLRKNARGVDINRNFPGDWDIVDMMYGHPTDDESAGTYRGRKAASEPETQAVIAFINAVEPVAVFNCHALASICGARFLGPKAAGSDTDYMARCERFTRRYADGMYPDDARPLGMSFITTPGSLPTWLYREYGIPAFDMEYDGNPDGKPSLTGCTTRDLLALYQRRHYGGIRAVLSMIAESGRSNH